MVRFFSKQRVVAETVRVIHHVVRYLEILAPNDAIGSGPPSSNEQAEMTSTDFKKSDKGRRSHLT